MNNESLDNILRTTMMILMLAVIYFMLWGCLA